MKTVDNRIFGLDLSRSIAITLVLIAHGLDFFITPFLAETLIGKIIGRAFNYPLGFFGVEIFFILSGYLIGGIIVKNIVEKNSWGNLIDFYIRRWFRTLPLYYLVVVILFIFPTNNAFSWQNLLFIQNFSLETLNFNPVSWSLSIEEWFYLTVPFIALLYFSSVKNNKGKHFIGLCVSIIGLSLLFRIIAFMVNEPNFDFGTRKQIFLRLDSIMVGVLLAGIKFYYKELYNRLIEKRLLLFIISLVGLGFCELWFCFNAREVLNASFFSRTLFFNIVSISCGLFVLSLETVKYTKKFNVGKVVTFISLISYGLYLWHFHIFIALKDSAINKNLVAGILFLLLAAGITVAISTLTFKYFEEPIKNLRDKSKFTSKMLNQNKQVNSH